MYYMLLSRTTSHEDLCVLMSWLELKGIWESWKCSWLQSEYEFEMSITMGQFKARSLVLKLDTKASRKEIKMEDFRDLTFDICDSSYSVKIISDNFEDALESAIELSAEEDNPDINNHDFLVKLLKNKASWEKWQEQNHNYLVYYTNYDL